ncbi:MAG: flagellar motor protein MotB [Rickettsiales bacterium]
MSEEKKEKQPQDNKAIDKKKQPIIIKRITVSGHGGHHGGAWKVAYADFVTAMMAFFLLLWLLNSTPSQKLRGIAQYFEPTVGLTGQKGIGFEGGKAESNSGIGSYDRQAGVKFGVLRKGNIISSPQKGQAVSIEESENEHFSLVEGELKKVIMGDSELSQYQDSILFEVSPEGLQIKITDQDKYPMFKAGSPELSIYTKNILNKIAKLIKYSPNFLAISGDTDAETTALTKDYSNWELSADRANNARRYLVQQAGIPPEQIARVTGRADTDPIDTANVNSPKNRRITITLLRNSVMPFNKISAPKDLLSSPEKENVDETLRVTE